MRLAYEACSQLAVRRHLWDKGVAAHSNYSFEGMRGIHDGETTSQIPGMTSAVSPRPVPGDESCILSCRHYVEARLGQPALAHLAHLWHAFSVRALLLWPECQSQKAGLRVMRPSHWWLPQPQCNSASSSRVTSLRLRVARFIRMAEQRHDS